MRLAVVAGVLSDTAGRVLLAQRKAGGDFAGLWEFPGGKREPGESSAQALWRELHEELGIEVLDAESLIRVPWDYAHKRIVLDVQRVKGWRGTPHAREGQGLLWMDPAAIVRTQMPPADWPALNALRLPASLRITPARNADALFDEALRGLRTKDGLLRLRLGLEEGVSERRLAARLVEALPGERSRVLLGGDIDAARALGCGLQLRAAQLAQIRVRPVGADVWCGASCHDAADLARAAVLDCDFAVLGPVLATPTHPGMPGLGWNLFASLCAAARLPVYALGGIGPDDLGRARAAGAQGVAGIRAFWT